jgi:hypothetical protein
VESIENERSRSPLTPPEGMAMKFNVGDRVARQEDVFDPSSRWMTGTVVRCYSDFASRFGPYPEIYAVEWDDGRYAAGYLPHGLNRFNQPLPAPPVPSSPGSSQGDDQKKGS